MKILVTGGAGFIGSNIVDALVARGDEVRVIDDFSTGRHTNIAHLKDDIELFEGNILDPAILNEAVAGIQVILHQAALSSVPRSHVRPIESNDANIRGTLDIYMAAHKHEVYRVVVASSSSVYGDVPALPQKESYPVSPKSIYAATKANNEHYGKVFSEVFGLSVVCLRYFNVFGPRQNPRSEYAAVIPKFIQYMLADKQPTINGDGKQSRDFSYVENIVNANILAATEVELPRYFVCNIACGERHNLLALVNNINTTLGKNISPLFRDERPGDMKHTEADISIAQKYLGFNPSIGFEDGLRKTIKYIIENER